MIAVPNSGSFEQIAASTWIKKKTKTYIIHPQCSKLKETSNIQFPVNYMQLNIYHKKKFDKKLVLNSNCGQRENSSKTKVAQNHL
jgi:hypothetical protein